MIHIMTNITVSGEIFRAAQSAVAAGASHLSPECTSRETCLSWFGGESSEKLGQGRVTNAGTHSKTFLGWHKVVFLSLLVHLLFAWITKNSNVKDKRQFPRLKRIYIKLPWGLKNIEGEKDAPDNVYCVYQFLKCTLTRCSVRDNIKRNELYSVGVWRDVDICHKNLIKIFR